MGDIEVPIQCSTDDFYNFFKNQAYKLRTVCGTIVRDICLVDGNETWIDDVGSHQQIYFVRHAKCLIKYEVSEMDVQAHFIRFQLLEGGLLPLFNNVTLEVINNDQQKTAIWTIIGNIPNPQTYLDVLSDISVAVDEYLRKPKDIVTVEILLQHPIGAAFYNFFKEQTNLLPNADVSPTIVKEIELVDGTNNWIVTVGSRKHICFETLASCLNSIKDDVIAINDPTMTITFFVLEGALLCYYHTFMVTLHVTDGRTAKWTIEYVKKHQPNPDPDDYLLLLAKVTRDVGHYLQNGVNPAQN